jgi:hypothetical protein
LGTDEYMSCLVWLWPAPYIHRWSHVTDEYNPHILIGDVAPPMNIWGVGFRATCGFGNCQLPFSVFWSRPPPFSLTAKSLTHTPPSMTPSSPGCQCRLLARPTAGAASLPSPPPLHRPAARRPTTTAQPPPASHQPLPPGCHSRRSRATVAMCHRRHRHAEGHLLLLGQPPGATSDGARCPTTSARGPPPVRRPRRRHELRWGLNAIKFYILNKLFEW